MQKIMPLFNKKSSKRKIQIILGVLLLLSISMSFFASPLNTKPYISYPYLQYGLPDISQHDRNIVKLLDLVPENASILTQDNLFPLLSNRLNAYLFPSGVRYPPGETFGKVLKSLIDKVDFIVLDLKTDTIVTPTILSQISENGNFKLYASIDGAIILKRNYTNSPILFQPFENVYNYKSFVLHDGVITKDPKANNNYVFLHSITNGSFVDFWYGPYVFLSPGTYDASFRMKISNPAAVGDVVKIYISCFLYNVIITYLGTNNTGYHLRFDAETTGDKKVLSSQTLNATDFANINSYQEFHLNFTVSDFGAYEFRGMTPTNNSNIYLDQVRITQIEPSENLNLKVMEEFPTG